jgi:hypothetical protein
LFSALQRDLAPVGRLEEMMVEKVAVCWWRQKRVLSCEVGFVRRAFVPNVNDQRLQSRWISQGRFVPTPELTAIKDHLRLPLSDDGDRILRYETAIERQLLYAINQLERLRRARKGEHVPAPVSVQVSADQ